MEDIWIKSDLRIQWLIEVEALFLERSEDARMVGNSPDSGKPSLHSLYMRKKFAKCATHKQLEEEWKALYQTFLFEFMYSVSESKYLDVG